MTTCSPRAARALGAGHLRIMAVHILPNAVSVLIVQATVAIPAAILGEAVLSFLGLGIQPPSPSLGTMLSEAQQSITRAPWQFPWQFAVIGVLFAAALYVPTTVTDLPADAGAGDATFAAHCVAEATP